MARRRRVRTLVILGSLLVSVASIITILRLRPTRVTVEVVARGPATEVVYATGTVEPRERVVVKARITEHVARVEVDEGDRVSRDQVLARIEDPVRRSALAQGQSRLAIARAQASANGPQLAALTAQAKALRAQLELARIELERTEKLAVTGAIPLAERDTARYRVDQLAAQTVAAEEQLRSTKLELGAARDQLGSQVASLASEVADTEVRSPIDGLVLRREIEAGELVTPNQALFEIADTRDLVIELQVDEADIARVHDGANASKVALSFYAFPSRAFTGRVTRIHPRADAVRRSYTVEVALDTPIPGLRVGMTTEANVIVQRKDGALVMPIEALDGTAAWFAEHGRAVKRDLVLGIRDLTHVEVLEGARDGDLAIVRPSGGALSPGARVEVAERRRP